MKYEQRDTRGWRRLPPWQETVGFRLRGDSSGLTIIEIMAGVAISSILIVALLRFLVAGYPLSKTTYLQQRSTETARLQLKRIAKQLREVRASDTGAYPLVELLPQRIVFFSDVDSDAATERIRYELVGTNLVRGTTEPSGNPLTYDPAANEEVVTVAAGVVNGATPLFVYYTGDYPADETALTSTQATAVKYIQFYLLIDHNLEVDPPPIEVRSQVQLRNLKTNLGQEVSPTPTP